MPRHSTNRLHKEKGGRSVTERDEFKRAAWRVMVAAAVEPEALVFVDECGVHTSLGLIYGYAPKGERLHLSVPRNRGKNTTLLSSMTTGRMGPSLTVADYNPIEEAFAKIKNLLRKAAARSKELLVEAIGAALCAVTAEDAWGYFEHAGHRATGQLL